jgi:hypothetical protein
MLNCKPFRSKLFWPCLKFLHSLLSGESMEMDEKLSQSCHYFGSHSNQTPLKYKPIALQIKPNTSVRSNVVFCT